ncbi:transposase, partial [Gordonia sputi]
MLAAAKSSGMKALRSRAGVAWSGPRRVDEVKRPWSPEIWMLRSTLILVKEYQGHGRAYVVVVGVGRTGSQGGHPDRGLHPGAGFGDRRSGGIAMPRLWGRFDISEGPRGHRPRDIPYGDDPIQLRWNKTRYYCLNPVCERRLFTESIRQVPARRRTAARLRTQIGRSIGDAARSVVEVAAGAGVSWPTAHTAFVEHAEKVLKDAEPIRVLGIDETRRGKPRRTRDKDGRRWVRVDPWDTGFVDLSGDQGLLRQTEGRTSKAVTDWLNSQSEQFRDQISYVVIDPSAAYAAAVTDALLPNAQVVVDHFHLVKLASDMVTAVRRRVTFDTHGRRGRTQDPEWANRRRLLCARERLSDRSFAKMWNALVDHDRSTQILTAYIAKVELRQLLSAAHQGVDNSEI